jgi:hypothetical protein
MRAYNVKCISPQKADDLLSCIDQIIINSKTVSSKLDKSEYTIAVRKMFETYWDYHSKMAINKKLTLSPESIDFRIVKDVLANMNVLYLASLDHLDGKLEDILGSGIITISSYSRYYVTYFLILGKKESYLPKDKCIVQTEFLIQFKIELAAIQDTLVGYEVSMEKVFKPFIQSLIHNYIQKNNRLEYQTAWDTLNKILYKNVGNTKNMTYSMDDGCKLANIVFDFPLIARRILMNTDKKAIPIFVTSTI